MDLIKPSSALKGQCHNIFDFRFFSSHESSTSMTPEDPLYNSHFFDNLLKDIHNLWCTTGVKDIRCSKCENDFSYILFKHYWEPVYTYRLIFNYVQLNNVGCLILLTTMIAGVVDNGGKLIKINLNL